MATWRDPAIVRDCGFQSAGTRGDREQRWQQLVGAGGRTLLGPGELQIMQNNQNRAGRIRGHSEVRGQVW